MYWNPKFYVRQVASLMPVNKWEELKSFLHFADNTTAVPKGQDGYDRQHKIRPLLTTIRERCLTVPFEENLSVDEQICAFKGRSGLKQYNPKKPHRRAYKIFVLSGVSGFPYNFELYSGQENVVRDGTPDCGASGNVVVRLCDPVPRNVRHKVYFDNYFNSPKLQVTLSQDGILSLGTVRANRLPNCRLKSEKELKCKGRGASEELTTTIDDVELSCVRWYDNRAVTFLSSFVGRDPVQKTKRWFTSAKEFREIDCPSVVKVYNRHMGGVDLLDSLLGLYRIHIRSKKWHFRIFTHMLDLSVVAAWLLYRRVQEQLGKKEVLPLAQFKIEIAECLASHNKCLPNKRPGRPSSQDIEIQVQAKKARGPVAAMPPIDIRCDQVGHWPEFDEKRQRCKRPSCTKKSSVRCKK